MKFVNFLSSFSKLWSILIKNNHWLKFMSMQPLAQSFSKRVETGEPCCSEEYLNTWSLSDGIKLRVWYYPIRFSSGYNNIWYLKRSNSHGVVPSLPSMCVWLLIIVLALSNPQSGISGSYDYELLCSICLGYLGSWTRPAVSCYKRQVSKSKTHNR